MKAQSVPAANTPPRAAATGRTRDQMLRPALLTHIGCRAWASSIRPQASTARWNKVHTGRSAAVCVVSQPRLCTANAAKAPASA